MCSRRKALNMVCMGRPNNGPHADALWAPAVIHIPTIVFSALSRVSRRNLTRPLRPTLRHDPSEARAKQLAATRAASSPSGRRGPPKTRSRFGALRSDGQMIERRLLGRGLGARAKPEEGQHGRGPAPEHAHGPHLQPHERGPRPHGAGHGAPGVAGGAAGEPDGGHGDRRGHRRRPGRRAAGAGHRLQAAGEGHDGGAEPPDGAPPRGHQADVRAARPPRPRRARGRRGPPARRLRAAAGPSPRSSSRSSRASSSRPTARPSGPSRASARPRTPRRAARPTSGSSPGPWRRRTRC